MSVNASEERLAALSRRTFLSMWSYQNPHYDHGKELCDVLVVFQEHVIIMSDKFINYSNDAPADVSWARWYKRAVTKSVAQLRGAVKTIQARPTSIYIDAKASSLLPLEIPKSARFHLMAIAHGSEEASQLERGTPSLAIDSRPGMGEKRFTVGVLFPEFVHVLNRTALDALFECFDTTVDLIHYLEAREDLFRSNSGLSVHSEEDLLALYMRNRMASGQGSLGLFEAAAVSTGDWQRLSTSPAFADRRKRLAPSYLIDQIIEQVANDYRTGAMLIGQELDLAQHACAFSTLASEPRMSRLLIGDALANVRSEDPTTFWGLAIESAAYPTIMYVWLIYPNVPEDVPDSDLERCVGDELRKYVFVAMGKFPSAKRFFGIAMANIRCKRTSRMFRFAKREIWDDVMQRAAEQLSSEEGIFAEIESRVYAATRAV